MWKVNMQGVQGAVNSISQWLSTRTCIKLPNAKAPIILFTSASQLLSSAHFSKDPHTLSAYSPKCMTVCVDHVCAFRHPVYYKQNCTDTKISCNRSWIVPKIKLLNWADCKRNPKGSTHVLNIWDRNLIWNMIKKDLMMWLDYLQSMKDNSHYSLFLSLSHTHTIVHINLC